MPFDPSNDPLGQVIALQQQARQRRFAAQVAHPNPIGPLPDPNWDAWFGAVNEAAGGKPVKFTAGASPEDSTQLTGFNVPADFVGQEKYGGSQPEFTGALAGLKQAASKKKGKQ